jgi:hypothetical protein
MADNYEINQHHAGGFTASDFDPAERLQNTVADLRGLDYSNAFDLYQLVWGYRATPYPLGELGSLTRLQRIGSKKNNNQFDPATSQAIAKYTNLGAVVRYTDSFGFEMLFPVWVINPNEKDPEKSKILLPYSTVEIEGSKNIVTTPLVGRNGSVKEIINIDDYKITIKGIYVNRESPLPEEGLKQFSQLWQINKALQIDSAIMRHTIGDMAGGGGYTYATLEKFKLPDMRGTAHAQAFELEFTTDINLELEPA